MLCARQIILTCFFSMAIIASGQTDEAMKLPECKHPFGKDSMKVRVNMGYLQKYYHEGKYNEAYGCWTYLFRHAPCAYKSMYQIGTPVIARLADENKDKPRRKGLADTLMMLFPARIKYFGEEGLVKGSWGYNMARYQPEKTSEILALFSRYVELRSDSLNEQYVRTYMWHGIKGMRKGLYDTVRLLSLYRQLSDLSAKQLNMERERSDTAAGQEWVNAIGNLDYMVGQLFSCRDIPEIFRPMMAGGKDSLEILARMFNLYSAKLCENDEGYFNVVEKIYRISPVTGLAEILAAHSEKQGYMKQAEAYYLEAIDLTHDSDRRAFLFCSLGKMVLPGDAEKAKGYARRAVFINPKYAEALILLGKSVFKSACGNALEKAMAACAATDLFEMAKSADPAWAAEADKQTAIYKAYFPASPQIEEAGLRSGDTYTIPCSGIKTTIRLR